MDIYTKHGANISLTASDSQEQDIPLLNSFNGMDFKVTLNITGDGTAPTDSTAKAMGIIDTITVYINDTEERALIGGNSGGSGNAYKYIMGLHEGLAGYTPVNQSPNTVVTTGTSATDVQVSFRLPLSVIKTPDRKKIKIRVKTCTTAGYASAHAGTLNSVTVTVTPYWSDDVVYDNRIISLELASSTSHYKQVEDHGLLDFVATYQSSDYISNITFKHGTGEVFNQDKTPLNNRNANDNFNSRSTGFNWVDLDNLPIANDTTYTITCSTAGIVNLAEVYVIGIRTDVAGSIVKNAGAPVYSVTDIHNIIDAEVLKFGAKLPATVPTRRLRGMQY